MEIIYQTKQRKGYLEGRGLLNVGAKSLSEPESEGEDSKWIQEKKNCMYIYTHTHIYIHTHFRKWD